MEWEMKDEKGTGPEKTEQTKAEPENAETKKTQTKKVKPENGETKKPQTKKAKPEKTETENTDTVIEVRNIVKTYGKVRALENVSLQVKRGSIYGLVGDNGAGKSTFLKLLAGHVFADSGEILLFGRHEEKELRQCRKRMGVIVEQPGYFPNMTVEKMLEYCRIQKGIPGKGKTAEVLELTGIRDKMKTKCNKLSLGQKQRLGLAMALLGEPEMLILDEPSNGLDPSGIIAFRELLLGLNREKNITVLISSHILSELQQIAGVFGFLDGGKLLEEISLEALYEKCRDSLDILVSDVEEYGALLEKAFPEENWRVLPEGRVRVSGPRRQPEAYSRLAAEHGLDIRGLEMRHARLEDYYIDLKRKNREQAGGGSIC